MLVVVVVVVVRLFSVVYSYLSCWYKLESVVVVVGIVINHNLLVDLD
jgi:hypothetical protein